MVGLCLFTLNSGTLPRFRNVMLDPDNCQVILSWLPGYCWRNGSLHSTGSAIPPTQHVDRRNGEVRFYVRPIFTHGTTVGLFIRRQGIVDAIKRGQI
jgi:hypothetical protein